MPYGNEPLQPMDRAPPGGCARVGGAAVPHQPAAAGGRPHHAVWPRLLLPINHTAPGAHLVPTEYGFRVAGGEVGGERVGLVKCMSDVFKAADLMLDWIVLRTR